MSRPLLAVPANIGFKVIRTVANDLALLCGDFISYPLALSTSLLVRV